MRVRSFVMMSLVAAAGCAADDGDGVELVAGFDPPAPADGAAVRAAFTTRCFHG